MDNHPERSEARIESDWEGVCSSFEEMGLKEEVAEGIRSLGFDSPLPLQQRAMDPFLEGRDVILHGSKSCGKSSSLLLGLLDIVDVESNQVQFLVAAGGSLVGFSCHSSVGGRPVSLDVEALRSGVHALVGTPGRLCELARRGALDTAGVSALVLDRADDILDLGFQEEVDDLLRLLPPAIQKGLSCAMLTPKVDELAGQWMHRPVQVGWVLAAGWRAIDDAEIKHFFVDDVPEEFNSMVVMDLHDQANLPQIMVYCHTPMRAILLANSLASEGLSVTCLHEDLSREELELLVQVIREGECRVIVCTGALLRGIDMPRARMIVCADVPSPDTYVQLVGRRGCSGRGNASLLISLVAPEEVAAKRVLEDELGIYMPELPADFLDLLAV